MSFGRRLALFFGLIAIVPTAALIAILLFVSEDSQTGIGGPVLGILVWLLITAITLAWALARTLTRLHQRVEREAVTDPLTGLWNRRYMAETMKREVARALRFGSEVSLIILDVDDFKKINDQQGHLQGDLVLEAVGEVVREATRTIDVAARYGGDELAVILVETDREGRRPWASASASGCARRRSRCGMAGRWG